MDKNYQKQILKILNSPDMDLFKKKYDFNGARRAIFNSTELLKLMVKNGISKTYEISSGVSDEKAFNPYLKQICSDILTNKYYRNYYVNKGERQSRMALAFYENLKFQNKKPYTSKNFCLTEGSTGAISAVIEYVSKQFPKGEVIFTNPCYYLFRSACQYYGIKYKELNLFKNITGHKITFTDVKPFIGGINRDTKLIIINNPFNPSGEIYSKNNLRLIFSVAKKNNILVLVDELFQDLVFNPENICYSDKIANDINALGNLVIVKGYSKNKNLVGFRLGYIFSGNREIIENIGKINQVRQSFPTASNFAGIIILDAFVQSVLFDRQTKLDLLRTIKEIRLKFPKSEIISNKSNSALSQIIINYRKYFSKLITKYSRNYDLCYSLLKKDSLVCMPKISAFNTFFKIAKLGQVNMLDFTLNLYVTTGVKIEIGPCFGFSQKEWEINQNLGFWLRLTFARDKKSFEDGLKKFILFKNTYLENKNSFLTTNLSF